jgi:class 3 adenylate cyclase/predicted ATPase
MDPRGRDRVGEASVDVAAWLHGLGLQQYEQAFRENAIDDAVLPELTADDLKDLGVSLVGHRRKLLAAILALRTESGPEPRAGATEVADTPIAERRHLSVMFCDLVGSTALSTRYDPEDLREIIAAYHRAVSSVVGSFDGFVAKYMGDGVLVYFGYPSAHENDAERAIRAGLGVIEAVGRLDLQARIGIATGLVVVGDLIGEGSAQEQSVVGETPNIAARLQVMAEPATVVIAASTRRLVGDLFEVKDLGLVEVKGINVPMPAWQVLQPSIVASRFEALRGSALSPLIGRDEEIGLLLRRWSRAKTGAGQIVLISGEAGIGKSRITEALAERLRDERHLRLRYFCSPYHQDSALYPFVDQLGRASGFARDDLPAIKLEKLEALLARAAPPDEDVALLADLLSLPASERHQLPDLSAQRKKERTLHALIHQLEGLAREQPVVVVVEDVHWIDPTSRELLDLCVESVRKLPVLLIVTLRPEFQPPWSGQPQVTMVTLNRLDQQDRAELVEQIAGGKALPDAVIEQIVNRTDGIPLFVEELTKSVLESGLLSEGRDRYTLEGPLPPFAIPTSLHDSLMARLDRMTSLRLVAQTGAAIGREFNYPLLSAVSSLPEEELQAALARLVASELVYQRGTPPDAIYIFKHALVQDAAHGSLLRSTRRQLHARIAEALESQSPETAETQPELLAYHYTEAGIAVPAIGYWRRAGERAAKRASNIEAIDHLRRGLGLLEDLPEREAHAEEELRLLIALGPVLMMTIRTDAPETQEVYRRARRLATGTGKVAELFATVWGSWMVANAAGNAAAARNFTAELFSIADGQDDAGYLLQAHHCAWPTEMNWGTLRAAHDHIEKGVALYSKEAHGHHALLYGGHDPAVCGYVLDAVILQAFGELDQALAQLDKGLALARELSHPPSLVHALVFGAWMGFVRSDPIATKTLTDELLPLVSGYSSLTLMNGAMMLHGWAMVMLGEREAGLTELRRGFDRWRATASKFQAQFRLGQMVATLLEVGEIAEGTALVCDALEVVVNTGQRWYEPELHRFKGLLQLASSGDRQAKAEACFDRAIEIARAQGTRLFELRAATSLARLRRDRGERAEARDLLAPIYGWFTEGFETADLREAKVLLDELA